MATPTGNAVAGLFSIVLGFCVLLAAFDVIPAEYTDFEAPRWVIAVMSFFFVVVGAWVVISRGPDWPSLGLLRLGGAALFWAALTAFGAAVAVWPERLRADRVTATAFAVLAVLGALLALRAVLRTRRPSP